MANSSFDKAKSQASSDRFDLGAMIMIGVLLLAIFMVIGLGDQIGLSVVSFSPRDLAASRSPIQITFDEELNADTVTSRIVINPPVTGQFDVSRRVVTFRPSEAMKQGQVYEISIQPGIKGSSGRELKRAVAWEFNIRAPRVVFLGPVDKLEQNLYMADPDAPDAAPIQLTFSELGVSSFDISPDGTQIVYAEFQDRGAVSLYMLEMATGKSSVLYDCPDAQCTNPVWRPAGNAIAFERVDMNTGTGMAPGVSRVWVLDMNEKLVTPLFADSQQLGYSPRWSADGTKLAVYNVNARGISIRDFVGGEIKNIETVQGELGKFSPDGRWLFFPKIVDSGDNVYVSHLVLVDIASPLMVQTDLMPDNDPANDVEATWLPDSKHLIVSRRPPYTTTVVQGPQLYQVNIETREATPLVIDDAYSHGDVIVSPSGEQIVFRRFALGKSGARPEIWMYHLMSGELKLLASNATMPRWIP